MKKWYLIVLLICSFYFFFPSKIFADTQFIAKQQPLIQGMYFPNEIKLLDPTVENQTIYSALLTSHAVDSYYFIPQHTASITIETLVPVRESNKNFGPAWELIGPNVPPQPMMIEFSIPTNSLDIGHDYYPPISKRSIMYDPLSIEPLYRGNNQTIKVLSGQMYYINVFEPYHYLGDYVLKLSNTKTLSFIPSISKIPMIALNQVSAKPIPWISLLGLFCAMSGLVIGLGFTASHLYFQKLYAFSPLGERYYRIAQVSSLLLFVFGLEVLQQQAWSSLVGLFQLVIAISLCFVFLLSPSRKMISLGFWLVELLSFVWYLFILR